MSTKSPANIIILRFIALIDAQQFRIQFYILFSQSVVISSLLDANCPSDLIN
jgi:hypothetical protein